MKLLFISSLVLCLLSGKMKKYAWSMAESKKGIGVSVPVVM